MKLATLSVTTIALLASSPLFAVTYGCGFNTGTHIGYCYTQKQSYDTGVSQVAAKITVAQGATYNYGSSGWGISSSYVEKRYLAPYQVQTHKIAGKHCWEYSNGSSPPCYSSPTYSLYF